MKNQLWVSLVLVFGLLFIGCPNPGGGGTVSENWTRITNFREIMGTWEGSITIPIPPMPISETEQLPTSSIDCTLTMEVDSHDFTEIINMNMNNYLTDIAGGVGKSITWEAIKNLFKKSESHEETVIEFTDDYHIILTVIGDVSQMEFTDENSKYAPYINEDKTKIKMILPEDINTLGEGSMEFILYKK
jgi:hypothetical protein